MKKCIKCDEVKPIDEFSFKNKVENTRHKYCKKCFIETRKKSYDKNKDHYINKAKKRTKEIVNWFNDIKKNLSCEICGFSHPAALDFHHINDDKDLTVSKLITYGNKDRILKEIEKCKVLCSNCHRILHYDKRNAPVLAIASNDETHNG